jgi:alkylhydroperoxidase/carboxymuconolactone decarboxylase family protein YurZ
MALTDLDRTLARLFAAVVLGRWDEVGRLRRDAPPGEPNRAWRETVLQAHVFAGFPRVVEAYGVLAAAGGLGEIGPGELLEREDARERGRELFERIYQADAGRIRELLRAGHPDFAGWIEEHAYGRILSRPGLPPDRRELLAVAGLAALGQERQLASHVRGSIRCGATREEVRGVLDAIRDLLAPARAERAQEIIDGFAS